jgi:hypothetical protein
MSATQATQATQRKTRWTEQATDRLREAINLYGTNDWVSVGEYMGLHHKVCRNHYVNVLKPINLRDWTPEEDRLLMELLFTHGPKWVLIQGLLSSDRTPKQLQNRCRTIKREQERKTSILVQKRLDDLAIALGKTSITAEPNPNWDPVPEGSDHEEFDWQFETLL